MVMESSTVASKISQAVSAYTNASKMKAQPSALEENTPFLPGDGPNMHKPEFSQVLGTALQKAKGAGYVGESQSALGLANETELHELVTAVTNAELTLQTVVAVRDRAVSAYQDITRMPI